MLNYLSQQIPTIIAILATKCNKLSKASNIHNHCLLDPKLELPKTSGIEYGYWTTLFKDPYKPLNHDGLQLKGT